jgi:CDP-4-dehydro-6-deoxyglucose reductase
MLQPWVEGLVTRVVDETETTKRFFIQIPSVERFDFEPGQFVTLDLPIHEQKNKRWRSYSIASAPNGTNEIELVIVKLEGGQGTSWLWLNGHVGSKLTLRGPMGKFVLPPVLDRDLYLICTGTGIAPFRSMVHHIKNQQLPHQNIYLIFGTRVIADLLYPDEMQALQSSLPGFHYLPVFSREPAQNTAGLRTGYVHHVYETLVQQQAGSTHAEGNTLPPPAYFFLCGWKNMIDEARQRLTALGYDKKSVHYELYG